MRLSPARRSIAAPVAGLLHPLSRVTLPLVRKRAWPGEQRLRSCVACGHPVLDDVVSVRYRGEYYHAGPCHAQNRPALRANRISITRSAAHAPASPA